MPRLKKQKEVSQLFSLRWKPSQRALIEKKAKEYTDGNLSEWLIYAAMNFSPSKKDLQHKDEEPDDQFHGTLQQSN